MGILLDAIQVEHGPVTFGQLGNEAQQHLARDLLHIRHGGFGDGRRDPSFVEFGHTQPVAASQPFKHHIDRDALHPSPQRSRTPVGELPERTVNLQERIVEQVFGRGPVPGIAHADCHQTPGETVVQLPPGRTVPLSAPLGQYPFIHLHR